MLRYIELTKIANLSSFNLVHSISRGLSTKRYNVVDFLGKVRRENFILTSSLTQW